MFIFFNIIPLTKLPFAKTKGYTYSSKNNIKIGQIVKINFANKNIYGIVDLKLDKNKLNTPINKIKSIDSIIDNIQLNSKQIELAYFISNYYHTSIGAVIKLMTPPVLKRPRKNSPSKTFSNITTNSLTPTQEQSKIINDIKKSKSNIHLIYGVTGSGKTEIYLQLISEAIKQNKQSIVLVPEISLTPQAIERYSERFGKENISIVHSNLSNSEKFLTWKKIKNNETKIIIGPRSAIFSPIRNLAYIIIDEEHDSSYKQYDQNPRYNAKTVAKKLAELYNAKLVLGSATPSLDSFYNTKSNNPPSPPYQGGDNDDDDNDNGVAPLIRGVGGLISKNVIPNKVSGLEKIKLHQLKNRITGTEMPKVEIVDMREEFKKRNFTIFSDLLQDKIKENLDKKRQIVLYLNRRGAATFVSCRDCGYVENCQNCDLPLTYHINQTYLICHHCNFNKNISLSCPTCKSTAFKYFGAGTQKIELELTKLFPTAKILRMDRDTTKTRESHYKFYEQFKNHKYDILIGTQMITKGWDLNNVGLVGIVSSDNTLNLPDFRASERTFQLITQVAGRTGRGEEIGEVVLQTYSPDNFTIQASANHNFGKFYKEEITNREELYYPPFSRLIKLFLRDPSQNKAEKSAEIIAQKLNSYNYKNTDIEIIGPSPAFTPRINNNYIFHIIIKIKNPKFNPKKLLSEIPNNWIIDIDPENLL